MSSIKKNFLYNIAYQILILIIPLITAPYLSRVIGAEGIGIYSYTYSIMQYFMLFRMLGINNYGNRCIAKVRDNKKELSKTFLSIYALQLITSIISIVIYSIYIQFTNEYKMYAMIQLIYLISICFDINWLFFGLEEFKLTVTRNTIIKIISTISIFILVKNRNDLYKYIFILAVTSLISQSILWIFLKKYITLVRITWNDIKKHIKPNLILFIPIIAVSLYNIMDKIMLGSMTNAKEVGLYENAEKIINLPTCIITALGTIMLPRISNLVAKGEKEKIKAYISKSLEFMMFLSIPMCLGIIAITDNFTPIFFGNDFSGIEILIKYLSLIIIFKSWANVIRTQYLVPEEEDKQYIISVFIGAIINIILNSILIPKYNSLGAVIGTIFAELVVMFYQTYVVKDELEIEKDIKSSIRFVISGLIMYLIVISFQKIIDNKIILIITQIIIGSIVYFIMNYRYILKNINLKIERTVD